MACTPSSEKVHTTECVMEPKDRLECSQEVLLEIQASIVEVSYDSIVEVSYASIVEVSYAFIVEDSYKL